MEILNNIWLTLTSENEMLVNIIFLLLSPLETLIVLIMFTTTLGISISKKQKLLYIIALTVEGILSHYLFETPINLLVNYIFDFILIYKLFNINILSTIIALIYPALVFTLLESLLLNPYLNIFNITTQIALTTPIHRLFFMSICYSIAYLLTILIFKKLNIVEYFKIFFSDNYDKKTKKILFTNLFLGLVIICVQGFINVFYIKTIPIAITFLSLVSLFTYFAINIYSLSKVIKLNQTTQDLQATEEYNKSLSLLYDNIKGFKHDFDNIVTTLGGFIKNNDIKRLEKYYYELAEDCQKTNNLATLNPAIINNPGIYSLLSSKYHKADENNIKINLDYFVDLNELKIKTYEFSRIFGILLDNAIEASSECDEKIVNITFRKEEKNHRHIVIVENTYNNPDVNINKIFEKGISGKKEHSGLGLWEIRQYMRKNNNLNLFTTKNNKFFKQQLEIYY